MGAEAKLYLQEHNIPQLFEGLMTGLIYNRPADPVEFLENALKKIKQEPDMELVWDMFIDKTMSAAERNKIVSRRLTRAGLANREKEEEPKRKPTAEKSPERVEEMRGRTPSVIKAAHVAQIADVPIILFMGGPGGGKTRHAAKVANALADRGLVHICMPDVIRSALQKYKDHYPEWKEANERYIRGELIPNHLALALVKAEMGRHPEAKAYFLEGFPREARQVEDFERQVRSVNMALIIDYDEKTLRDHMEKRGLGMEIIDQKIKEFKQKTLPSAKYFDDQKLLHLIPGEKDDQAIYERMKGLVEKAMDSGLPVLNSNPPSQATVRATPPPHKSPSPPSTAAAAPIPVAVPEPEPAAPTPPMHEEPAAPKPPTPGTKPSTPAKPPTSQSERSVDVVNGKPPSRPESKQSRQSTANSTNRPPSRPKSSAKSRPTTAQQAQPEPAMEVVVIPPSKAPTPAPPTPLSRNLSTPDVEKGLPNNAPVVLIVGAPGSQKSDLAQRVAQKYDGFVLISMGELLRRHVLANRDDELWQRVSVKMDSGEPIPSKLCKQILHQELHEIGQTAWGYVIEGYPRTQSQSDDLEATLNRLDIAILIDCTENFCEDTVKKRYELNKTDRPDDKPDTFKARLANFKQNTLPMLKSLDDKGKLRVVDGDADAEQVFKEISQAIDSALFIGEDDGSGHSLDDSKKGSLQ